MDTLAEIRERRDAVVELEKSLTELHQIFLDMAVLVEAQGEMIDNIEAQVRDFFVVASFLLVVQDTGVFFWVGFLSLFFKPTYSPVIHCISYLNYKQKLIIYAFCIQYCAHYWPTCTGSTQRRVRRRRNKTPYCSQDYAEKDP